MKSVRSRAPDLAVDPGRDFEFYSELDGGCGRVLQIGGT